MAVSKFNNDGILEGVFEHAINAYLQKGETRESMLKKFNGDKTELIKFLNDRSYKEWIKNNKKPADTSDIKKKIDDLKKQHEEDIVEGRLKLYDTDPRSRAKVDDSPPPPIEPEPEAKPSVKYVEPPALKKKWSKKKEKPSAGKNQSSLF